MLYEKLTQDLDTLIRSFIAVDETISTYSDKIDALPQEQQDHLRSQIDTFNSLLDEKDV